MPPRAKRGVRSTASPFPRMDLPLAELELLSCLRTSRLLALDRTRIAREQTEIAKLPAMPFIHLHQRTSDGKAQRASLPAHSTALEVRLDVELAESIGGNERLLDLRHEHRTREVIAQRAAIDVPLTGSRLHVHAADGFLAAANGVCNLRIDGHRSTPRSC